MASPQREQLERAVVGYQKTFKLRIKHAGAWVNGGDYETPTALAWDESGNAVVPTLAWVSPQTGAYMYPTPCPPWIGKVGMRVFQFQRWAHACFWPLPPF